MVVEAIQKYELAVSSNYSEERINQLKNDVDQKVFANEELFGELDFNHEVDIFVIK